MVDEIYSIDLVTLADINSFKTIDVKVYKSEWLTTLGIDTYRVFLGYRVLQKKNDLENSFSRDDSMYSKYFY